MCFPFGLFALLTALTLPLLVRSDCECGFVVENSLYTDQMVTDFLHSDTISAQWQPQSYSVPQSLSRGPLGKMASPENLVANPLTNKDAWSGTGKNGGDAGLQLIVPGGVRNGLVPMAELVTVRGDFLYGSFRAGMKLTGTSGTCASIFWVCRHLSNTLRILFSL